MALWLGFGAGTRALGGHADMIVVRLHIKKAPKGLDSRDETVEVHEHENQHWYHEDERTDE